jgi:hypothetical protein
MPVLPSKGYIVLYLEMDFVDYKLQIRGITIAGKINIRGRKYDYNDTT